MIPAGGLTITMEDDGSISNNMTLHIGYDMYPQWLMIAVDHAEKCAEAGKTLDSIWTDGGDEKQLLALELEMREGMQAISAAAIAIDGFYGTVVDRCPLPGDVAKKWREKKLARYSQVAEALRMSFKIGNKSFLEIRDHLKVVFAFRDEAVHPSATAREPVNHPRLGVATERRLAIYSADNAMNVTKFSLNLIGLLIGHPKQKHTALIEHCQFAKEVVYPVLDQWEAKHGQIFARETHT